MDTAAGAHSFTPTKQLHQGGQPTVSAVLLCRRQVEQHVGLKEGTRRAMKQDELVVGVCRDAVDFDLVLEAIIFSFLGADQTGPLDVWILFCAARDTDGSDISLAWVDTYCASGYALA